MKPIKLTQPYEDLPEGLVFYPVSAHAWVASYDGRTITIKREEWDDGVFDEYLEEVRDN